ncbi:FAD-binding oxidoreductase [Pararhodobacter sp. SW119]|uniref:NAD(P)/FAD-dependent oxidoreductase n=1 Tax=Pararhodobacter sp. SW119 TaxID=2780075 RepID=UPI001AE03948|nr:FAD-binding oxidoreductase [Pararhodobacter sp. SW119]
MSQHILVVGAGVIGAAIAHDLQRRGRRVTLIDRDAPGMGASFGNMASIAVTEFVPVSRPAVLRQIPSWLFNPDGPVAVRPGYLPRLFPWFARFVMAARPARARAIEAAGAALCAPALRDTQALLADLGAADLLNDTGCLALYAGDAEFASDRDHVAALDRFGVDYQPLDRAALTALEPELAPLITRALLFPDNRSLRDPHRYVTALVDRFQALGGTLRRAEVTGVDRSDRVTGLRLSDGETLSGDAVVLCAGAHTARLARDLREPIPLETERGYHTQIMAPGIKLRHALIWPARAFMVTPTAGGIRVGGTVEMAGLDAPPDWNRARLTVRHARAALPGLQVQQTSEWMGHRPALPDTVPILSPSARTRGLFYATGHGHLGVTQAATTARLMGQLIDGATPDLDLRPYRVDRF